MIPQNFMSLVGLELSFPGQKKGVVSTRPTGFLFAPKRVLYSTTPTLLTKLWEKYAESIPCMHENLPYIFEINTFWRAISIMDGKLFRCCNSVNNAANS
jgi:hypothetical protein